MIKTIKWKNYKLIGDLELKFYDEKTGHIYNTIILAGENGTGKTTILDTLSTFLNRGSFAPFNSIEYEIDGATYTALNEVERSSNLGFYTRINHSNGSKKNINSSRNNRPSIIEEDPEDIRHYGCSYSKVHADFNTKQIKSTSTEQLDKGRYDDDKENFTSVKQLLIDINSQDANDWLEISKEKPAANINDYEDQFKMFRFRNAFDKFFDELDFYGIDDSSSDEINVIFKKHGQTISIDELSTGEKQIVFRGTHLLKNMNSLRNGVVLIDEPELSMHPKWQEKILQYYRGLFTPSGKDQTVQMIIATHSEYVIKAAMGSQDDVLIIMLKDDGGIIRAKPVIAPITLNTITAAEINYLAFNIISTDYHIELYGYLQNKYGLNTVKSCDDYIEQQPQFNSTFYRESSFKDKNGNKISYNTLPTYIRNAIDHPDPSKNYTQEELERSIKLLIELCK